MSLDGLLELEIRVQTTKTVDRKIVLNDEVRR